MKQVSDQPLPPSRIVPDDPAVARAGRARALAKDPTLRYQTAADMAADLERVRRGVAPSALTQQFTTPTMPGRRGHALGLDGPAGRSPAARAAAQEALALAVAAGCAALS